MLPLHRLYVRVHEYGIAHTPLYILSLMMFFFAVFDGVVSYVFPLAIEQNGFSKTMLGIIIGSSSVTGAVFDIILARFIKNTHFRRMYLLMFAICLFTPFVLWSARPLWIFLVAAALWGIYYDFQSFGNFDFIARTVKHHEHSGSFGILWVFSSLGNMIAPILAGIVIGGLIDWQPYVLMYAMLGVSLVFFCILLYITPRRIEVIRGVSAKDMPDILKSVGAWHRIGKVLLPVLLLTGLLNVLDAFFWTLGPLLAESYRTLFPFSGIFLTVYELPPLLVGWFIGMVTARFGKKRTAFFSFIAGSLLLSLFPFLGNPYAVIAVVFVSSCLFAAAWPSLNGAYADYISQTENHESEITSLQDFAANAGYVVGPVLAGVLADNLGNSYAFTVLGVAGALAALVLWRRTPRHIVIPS